MIRFLFLALGMCCLTMMALVIISPWWRRIAMGVLALLAARNVSQTPMPGAEPPEPSEEVIEGEFRVLEDK